MPPVQEYHLISLEAAAKIGCPKCLAEHSTGTKTTKPHALDCPRRRRSLNRSAAASASHQGSAGSGSSPGTIKVQAVTQGVASDVMNKASIMVAAPVAAGGSVAEEVAKFAVQKRTNEEEQKKLKKAGGAKSKDVDDEESSEEGDDDEGEDVDIASNDEGDDDDNDKKPSATTITETPPTNLVSGNTVDFPLSSLHSHLICSLCKGYFRDPNTVAECMHTFCRSCLILFFRQGMRCCPTCNTRLGPDPFHKHTTNTQREVIPDRTLAEVVNKIFPWLKTKEEEDERDFYAARGIDLKREYVMHHHHHHGGNKGHHHSSPRSSSHGHHPKGRAVASSTNPSTSATMGGERMENMMELLLKPEQHPPHAHQRLPPLRRAELCLTGRAKVVSLKKFVVQKLGLKESKSSIEILCNGDPMGDELSMTFIARTRWFSQDRKLTLRYRLEEEAADGRNNDSNH